MVGAAQTWKEVEGQGEDAGLHWPAEAEGQVPPCAVRFEGCYCRTKTKRGRGFREPPLLDSQLVTGIRRWDMLGRLGGDMGQTLLTPTPWRRAQPEQVLGRGQRLMHQKTGLVASPGTDSTPGALASPLPPGLEAGNSRNGTEHGGEKRMRFRTQR